MRPQKLRVVENQGDSVTGDDPREKAPRVEASTNRPESVICSLRPTVQGVKDYGSYQAIKSADLPVGLKGGRVHSFSFDYFQFTGGRYTAIHIGELGNADSVLLRINSRCVWGDLGSVQCDCRWQFEEAKERIADEGQGLIIFCHDQVGKGIGIREHHLLNGEAYRLGIEDIFYEAYLALGFKPDYRDYSDAIAIVRHYRIRSARMLTNNPDKIRAFEKAGMRVDRVPIIAPLNEYNRSELLVKRDKVKHWIEFEEEIQSV